MIIKKFEILFLGMLYMVASIYLVVVRMVKPIIKTYKAVELAILEKKTKPTIYNNGRKYIPIQIPSKRSKKGYSIRYIKKSDLDHYLKENAKENYWISEE